MDTTRHWAACAVVALGCVAARAPQGDPLRRFSMPAGVHARRGRSGERRGRPHCEQGAKNLPRHGGGLPPSARRPLARWKACQLSSVPQHDQRMSAVRPSRHPETTRKWATRLRTCQSGRPRPALRTRVRTQTRPTSRRSQPVRVRQKALDFEVGLV